MKKPTRIEIILASLLGILILTAASPIKDLVFQGDVDAAGYAITNLGTSTNTASATTLGYVQTNFATAAQGILAASALQPDGDGSALTNLSKTQVGLGNVENTADADKPVSTATQTELDTKQSAISYSASAPASPTDTGTAGSLIYAGGYLYICIATDTWLRAQLLTW